MKAFIVRTLAAALMLSNAFAQTDPRIQQFDALPSNQALELYRDTGEPPGLRMEMMRAALRDKRMDLLTMLFKDFPSFFDLFMGLNEMPNSEFKDKVVVMMLRTESRFWKREKPVHNGSRGVVLDNAIEPFVKVVSRLLPAVTIDENLFSTKKERLKLAAELEESMARKDTPREKEQNPQESQIKSPVHAQVLTQNASAAKPGSRKQNETSSLRKSMPIRWWVIAGSIVLLLAALAAWFKARTSRFGS